jgi:hypothetical protein
MADKLDFMKLPDGMTEQERNLIKYHRNHLRNDTYFSDEQGMTTIFITGVTGPDNRIYNVPGYFDGKRQTEEASYQRAAQTGWENYPSYKTEQLSNEAAIRLHDVIDQDAEYFETVRYGERPR